MNTAIGDVKNELDILRLSVKRIAQCVGFDESEIPYHAFGTGQTNTAERGWNDLCAKIINRLEENGYGQ